MIVHGLYGLLRLIMMSLEKQQEFLIVKILPVDINVMLNDVLLKLFDLLKLVFVVLDLSIIEKPGTLFSLLGFYFFYWKLLEKIYLKGKNGRRGYPGTVGGGSCQITWIKFSLSK